MALPGDRLLQAINQTAEALNSCERAMLLYLCDVLDTDNSVACVKEMLTSKMGHERGEPFLTELLWHLKRFDILRKVCKTSRDDVEKALKHRQVLPRYRVLMANINGDMADEDLKSIKFLLSNQLPREKMEKAKTFLDVIIELEKLDVISPERVDFVEECFKNISRVDLAKQVNAYKMSVLTCEGPSSQQQRHRVTCPLPPPNSSHPLHQPRHAKSLQTEHKPVSVYREQDYQRQLDQYKCNTNPRGVCVIIDCVGYDGEMLEQTFKALHFNVILHKWLNANNILAALRGIFRQRENREGDGFVCCIISRGTANHLLGTDSHGAGLRLDDVRCIFNADVCPTLAGKPKLFFIQRYIVPEFPPRARIEHRDEDLETDGCDGLSRRDFIPIDADVFWSHCSTDEFQLQRGHHRSIYLKALTDALHKGQIRKTHLVDLHTEVNGAVFDHNKRNAGEHYKIDLKHTLRKDLYLQ